MNNALAKKLKTLPRSPGVYFHKSESGEIIYVGKAAVLKNRVRQYFPDPKSKSYANMDTKTKALVAEIHDTDWIEVESELDALFLESEMVKRYMPRYNILLRDDKSQMFLRIDMKSEWPYICFTRNPSDDGADYYGPYYNGFAIKKALRYLRRVFPYYVKPPKEGERPDLYSHLGLSPSPDTTSAEYKKSLRNIVRYIKGGRKEVVIELEKAMKQAAKAQNFEEAARLRNKLSNLRELQNQIMFGDKEFLDISKDQALSDLAELLNLPAVPSRIEGYDISHMSGTNVVASMVVFTNGVSNRAEYRKFKVAEKNNDFENMHQVICRRFSERNVKGWGVPSLVLIDGGKGQLGAATRAVEETYPGIVPLIGIAKKEEQIVINMKVAGERGAAKIAVNRDKLAELNGYVTPSDDFLLINLPHSTHIVKLLQRVRDESHRFAVSYHTVLKRAQQKSSGLEDIPGIGPSTRRKLIRQFGSLRAVKESSTEELAAVVGRAKAKLLSDNLSSL